MTELLTMTRRTRAEIAAGTREAILAAACEVIADIGFENVRMRIVAERDNGLAGVGPLPRARRVELLRRDALHALQ